MVVIGVKFVSTFVDWGYQALVPNIGEDARAKDDVKEFKSRKLFSLSLLIEDRRRQPSANSRRYQRVPDL